jgi:hypothetical protein
MTAVKAVLRILGAIMVLMGVVWVGQGSGTFPYPASSFMIDQTPWIYYGLIMAVAGVVVMVMARRV